MDKPTRIKGAGYYDILVDRSTDAVHVRQHSRHGSTVVVLPLQQIPAVIAAIQEAARG